MRVHPALGTAVIALVVVIAYSKFSGGKSHGMRIGS
jgi:hypothetical protein